MAGLLKSVNKLLQPNLLGALLSGCQQGLICRVPVFYPLTTSCWSNCYAFNLQIITINIPSRVWSGMCLYIINIKTEMFTLRAGIRLLCRVAFGQMISSIKGLTVLSDESEAVWQWGRETCALWEMARSVGMTHGQTEVLLLSISCTQGTWCGRDSLQVGAQQHAARKGVGSCWCCSDLQRSRGDCQPLLLASNTSFCNWLHKMGCWSTGRGNIPSPCTLRLRPAYWEVAWAWDSACFQEGASSRSALDWQVMGVPWSPTPEYIPRDEWSPFPPRTWSPICCSCCFLSLTKRCSMAPCSGGMTRRTDGWCLAVCRISDQMGCSSELVSQILQAWRQFDTLTSEPYAPIFLSMAGVQSYLWL